MNLEVLLEETVDYANMLIEVAIMQESVESMGNLCNDISRYYRAMGIYDLLINADTDGFFYGLIQSALTRKYYLDRCVRERFLSNPERMSSFVDPFFDAVAANQLKLATDIARLSPDQWLEDYEYEDDFTYAYFFYRLIRFDEADATELTGIISQFERALEGQSSVRLELCKALIAKEQAAFDEAFANLLNEHQSWTDALAEDSMQSHEFTFEANRRIFVEGLAILRIAEQLRLETQEEYILCPNMAYLTDYEFVPDSFPNIDLDS
jgi:hypothetical protein